MSETIIDLQDWLVTDAGRYLLDWEQSTFDSVVADVFGYHALQLGVPPLHALANNRMPYRWLAVQELREAGFITASKPQMDVSDEVSNGAAVEQVQEPEGGAEQTNLVTDKHPQAVSLLTDFSALPFPAASLDLVVMPHTLEASADAHATLREVERVLVPQGRVVICGFNPVGLWALRQARSQLWDSLTGGRWSTRGFLPAAGEYIGYWRLRDWLRLLDFEVEVVRFGCYVPAVSSPAWLQRFAWMERLGPRWWPIFGSSYLVVGVKRVRGVRMLGTQWKATLARASRQLPAGQSNQDALHKERMD